MHPTFFTGMGVSFSGSYLLSPPSILLFKLLWGSSLALYGPYNNLPLGYMEFLLCLLVYNSSFLFHLLSLSLLSLSASTILTIPSKLLPIFSTTSLFFLK